MSFQFFALTFIYIYVVFDSDMAGRGTGRSKGRPWKDGQPPRSTAAPSSTDSTPSSSSALAYTSQSIQPDL